MSNGIFSGTASSGLGADCACAAIGIGAIPELAAFRARHGYPKAAWAAKGKREWGNRIRPVTRGRATRHQ